MAHTNGMKNFWSHLKRGLDCIYHWVSREHLQRSLDLQEKLKVSGQLLPFDYIETVNTPSKEENEVEVKIENGPTNNFDKQLKGLLSVPSPKKGAK